jgi:uncharacterized membrane protein required for colicin V production
MTLDFTAIALSIIVVFGAFGWVRGVKRAATATGGVFFAMIISSLVSSGFSANLARLGIHLSSAAQADLVLAVFFAFTVYIVQLGAVLLIFGRRAEELTRRQRLSGMGLGLLNGFLIVANVVRLADPYLSSMLNGKTGGWTWQLPLPHFGHPDPGTFTLSIQPTALTIKPSPLLKIYDSLPLALILLFAFLVFVFVGTMYGRVMRARD